MARSSTSLLHAPWNVFSLQETETSKKKIVHVCGTDPHKRANGAYLMGAYLVISQKKKADDAWKFFASRLKAQGLHSSTGTVTIMKGYNIVVMQTADLPSWRTAMQRTALAATK